MSESLARALGDIDRLVRELAHDLDDACPLRTHRAGTGLPRAGGTTRSNGCSAASPSTAPATTRCARPSSSPYLHADRRGDAIALLRDRATASSERPADGRAPRRRGRAARRRARLGPRPARAGRRARRRRRRARHGAARRWRDRSRAQRRHAASGAVAVRLELARIAAVDDLDAALQHYQLLVDSRARDLGSRELRQRHPPPARHAQGGGAPRARRRGHRVRPRRARGAHAPRTLVTMLDKLGWW